VPVVYRSPAIRTRGHKELFRTEFAEAVALSLPDPDATWWAYDNPFEQKFLLGDFDSDVLKNMFKELNSHNFVRAVSLLTGIDNLESDPHMHSAGLHAYPRNGKIDIHLDYTIHPKSKKERRVSLMVYMNKDWKPEYKGRLHLWNNTLSECTPLECTMWNTAVIFKTSDDAYHSVESVMCPPGKFRKVVGLYYLTEPRAETLAAPRYSAELFPTPGQAISQKLARLYDIRKQRRLEPSDLTDWPDWRADCHLDK
jgi:hypothetical protein